MARIINYQKYIDTLITRELALPEDPATHQRIGTELCTINGITYVSLPDGAELPTEQPPEIMGSIAEVVLTADLRRAIEDSSSHVALIRARVADKIAEQYSLGDEIKLLRTAPSAEFELYNAYVEDCRAWGRAQKAALGL